MPQLNDLHAHASTRPPGGWSATAVQSYPLRPSPKIAALLIDPDDQTIRTVYVHATAAGLRAIFGDARVTYTDKHFFRAYGTNQYREEVTDRATLPNARFSVQGKVLITGPDGTGVSPDISTEIMRETTFSRCDAYQAKRLNNFYSFSNFLK
ncbi:hypothetical protein [Neolewinella agarilytica]|uniref:Uncharacterized protein n=1 Tax=Neolewinella agarilytica TaxID=478744 RepID=A0A1H9HEJ6_9BACT|nr:hypothetical protein [Neolewinella agarilytica]SEQ60813.1 hypothetical protein SAMN05444359_112131 [Neolewinella agarilytica]